MKNVLITGADRGLGRAFTECFLERGFVVFAGQFMPQWQELRKLKETWKERLQIVPLDISDDGSVERLADLIGEKTETLDMVIHNAGIMRLEEDFLLGVSAEDMMLQFRVNTLGAMKVTGRVLGLMKNGKKRLCFVSSEAGSIGNAHRDGLFGYCMSKASLNMGIRMLHNELYPKGFTFRIYHPGWMDSYMADGAGNVKMNGYLDPGVSARAAADQFLADRECEDILAMQDVEGCLWSF